MSDSNDPSNSATDDDIFPRSPLLMDPADSTLLVVDLQEKLLPAIHDHQRIAWNIRRLIDGAKILGVELAATEQYPKGLGHTVEPIRGLLKSVEEKAMFSCRECTSLFDPLVEADKKNLLVVGIETHVCVLQTVLDTLAHGFDVFVAADAVGSRFLLDYEFALRRMELSGAVLTTTETILFEWCQTSGSPEFKQISQLVRETPPDLT